MWLYLFPTICVNPNVILVNCLCIFLYSRFFISPFFQSISRYSLSKFKNPTPLRSYTHELGHSRLKLQFDKNLKTWLRLVKITFPGWAKGKRYHEEIIFFQKVSSFISLVQFHLRSGWRLLNTLKPNAWVAAIWICSKLFLGNELR